MSRYAEEYKSKYLQYDCEKNLQLSMMGAFLASLDESIRCKVWERENLPTTMLELLNVVIWLGNAREVGRSEALTGKKPFERFFGGNKPKFAKQKWEPKEDPEGGSSGKPATPKGFVKRPKRVDAKDVMKKGLCFTCGKAGHVARDCREGGTGKVECNSTMISPRQAEELETLIKDRGPTFKRGHKVLESLSLNMLVAEGSFEAKLSLINPSSKRLDYLKGQVNGINVSLLVDTGATNSFMTPECARRLKVAIEDMALPVKVNFAQGSCQVARVARSVRFKAGAAKFEEDFNVCELGGVDVVLGNTFLHFYGIEVRQRPSLQIVMVDADGKLKPLPHTRVAGLGGLGINLVSQQDLFEGEKLFSER